MAVFVSVKKLIIQGRCIITNEAWRSNWSHHTTNMELPHRQDILLATDTCTQTGILFEPVR